MIEEQFQKALIENLYDGVILKNEKLKSWYNLAEYQIKNSLKLIWGAVEIEKMRIIKKIWIVCSTKNKILRSFLRIKASC
ncbi:MAG: hypothetical protein N2Z80_04580 [Hydrogenothermaceae bacterium]|nr:hypothetical protein [Hydrogenothermaceae bacterium]